GNLDAHDVSVKQGASRLGGIRVTSSIRMDPKTIAVNELRLLAFGGELTAEARLENRSALTVKGNLRGFQIPNVTAALASKPLRYAGSLAGTLEAQDDLKAPGLTGLAARARLAIAPGGSGTPISGRISADFDGKEDLVSLNDSYLALPSTRIDL